MVSVTRLHNHLEFKLLSVLLFLILISHAVGVLLPETGFDALWYHLPIVKDMAQSQQLRSVPGIPQSDQPRLGEIIFLPGFMLLGMMGVKITAFLIAILFLLQVYKLAKVYLASRDALLVTVLTASFHVVAWQSSSAYVDLLRGLFEVTFLHTLTKKKEEVTSTVLAVGTFMGSILTKLVSLVFVPSLLWFAYRKRSLNLAFGLGFLTLIIYLLGKYPIAFFWHVGGSLIDRPQVISSIKSFLILPLQLSFHHESYLAPIYLFAIPFIFVWRVWFWKTYRDEIIFLAISFLTWVFVVPISTRYNLSAIVLASILCVRVILESKTRVPQIRLILVSFILVTVCLNMGVRLGANLKALPFLLGRESESQYLQKYNKGIIKGVLERWYNE